VRRYRRDDGLFHHHRELQPHGPRPAGVLQKGYPTATGVLVAGLLRKDALIEISAIAVLPAGRR
jgi:hypothetical protein